jgi:hypothetical protein
LAAKTPPSLVGADGRKKLANFSAQTYGVRAGSYCEKQIILFRQLRETR